MFYGVGEISGMHDPSVLEKGFLSNAHIAQTFGHAVVGCFSASIAGGSCGAGAASAGFAAAAGPLLPGADISPERFVSRVIVGGIASRLAGGSFANGATSAAFAYLFNDMMHSRDTKVTLVGRYAAGIGEDLCSPSCLHLAVVISDNYYGVSLLDGQPNVGLTGVKLGPRQVSEFQKNTVFSIDLQPPEGQSARQFAEQLKFNATVLSPRGVPYTIPNLPSGYLAPGQFNSNSFASGLLQSVYGYVPNVSFGRNQAPGWSNPLPKKYFGGGG
jgi:hypothetical protein